MAYRCAYQVLNVYWEIAHPQSHGALVVLWHEGRLLLVQNSYVPFRSLPGGAVRKGEAARDAAVRELREEVGIEAHADQLVPVIDLTHDWYGKKDHVEIFSLELAALPIITVDNREVIHAAFVTPAEAKTLPLFPPIRLAIERREAAARHEAAVAAPPPADPSRAR